MERIKLANKRIIAICVSLIVMGIVICIRPPARLQQVSAFPYLILITLWSVTIRQRIVDGRVRKRVLIACFFMVFLFFLRTCKYSFFPEDPYIKEYLWYAYTLPLTAIPLFMFSASLYIEPVRNERKVRSTVLSAYIKRMGNLMLLTEETHAISSAELGLAIGESLDYLKLNGCLCDLEERGSRELAPAVLLLAYELFETSIEAVWLRLHTISVTLDSTDSFEMTIVMDASAESINTAWKDKELKSAGCKVTTRYADETYYIKLRCESSDRLDGEEVV